MAKTKKTVRKRSARGVPKPDGTWTQASSSNQIRNWRIFRGYQSHQELAAATQAADPSGKGILRATICRLESGTLRYTEEKIELLAKTLQVAPRDLIGTNPNNAGDIFAIYAQLPPRQQAQLKAQAEQLRASN
jgi:transcriptional regulator with XRE-family HTH domain